jgi:tetratricopeptide (TPR) repeat protein
MKGMKKLFISVLLVILSQVIWAQEPIALYDNTRLYREALELFDHEKYVAAKEKFEQYINEEKNPQHALRINSEYYNGICALYLLHKDAEYQLEKFVLDHPDSPWKQHVYFELANFSYKNKQYKKALEWFEFVEERNLSKDKRIEFYYKRGHARFETGDLVNARTDLFEAKQADSDFKQAATYYYSHIAYEQGDYQTALEGFLALDNDPIFKPLVPYYITQIYYKQKKYDEVIAYGPKALQQAEANSTKRVPEIARLIGDSYCIKGMYAEAIPYLEQYHNATPKGDITREDFYQLGYAYHRTAQWQRAIDAYSNCNKTNDELHQLASYNMGECYLKLGQKEYARNAFDQASRMEHNREIQEDALFNYAKLAFELSYNPFHEAISAFEDYLNKYPNSPRRDEAYEFLLNVYMKTRNYEKALNSLDKIQKKDARVKEAYQVVAYNRGVELFQSEDYTRADSFFDKVFTYDVNPTLSADARFWKAELKYRQKEYSTSVQRYNDYMASSGAYASEFYGLANYGQGYAYFKMGNNEQNTETALSFYNKANTAFRKYVDGSHSKETAKVNDSYARIGDCFLVGKNYSQAISYYDKVTSNTQGDKEYALFQKGMSYGYNSQNDQKVSVLKGLLSEFPNSKFIVEAKYEIAKTYLSENRIAEAKSYYNDILSQHANSQYAKYAMRDMCLVYLKEGNEDKVKETWVQLKTKYPNDQVLKEAYTLIRSVLIADPAFQNDAMTIGGATKNEVEEEVFSKAVIYAQDGNCNQAVPKLTDYLNRFQPAYYGLDAHYYLANCYYDQGNMTKALESYNFVISKGSSNYLEECLVVAATINYNNKNYQQALNNYKQLEQIALLKNNVLEAQIGLMRCNYLLNNFSEAKSYADIVLGNASTPDEIRTTAYLWRGRILMQNGTYEAAMSDFNQVIKKGGSMAAESKYSIAFCQYKKLDYSKAESEVFSLIEKYSTYDEWKFKGFILLVDIYIGMKDYYQARETINAIKENVSEQWVLEENAKREAQLNALENSGTGGSNNDIEIDLKPNNN